MVVVVSSSSSSSSRKWDFYLFPNTTDFIQDSTSRTRGSYCGLFPINSKILKILVLWDRLTDFHET